MEIRVCGRGLCNPCASPPCFLGSFPPRPSAAKGSASSVLQSRKQGIQRNVPSPVQGQLRKPITWARGSRHPTGVSGPWGPGRPHSAPGTGKNEALHFFSADFFCTRSRPSFLSLFPAETVKWSYESGKIMSTTGEQTKWLFCKRLPSLVSSPSPLEDLITPLAAGYIAERVPSLFTCQLLNYSASQKTRPCCTKTFREIRTHWTQ